MAMMNRGSSSAKKIMFPEPEQGLPIVRVWERDRRRAWSS